MNGQKIVQIAEKEIGFIEDEGNKTKYGKWFGWDGVPWCGIFVSWVYDQAKLNLGNIGFLRGFAGCQTAVVHFTKTQEITKTPQMGDIVFLDWNKDRRYDHVGIFVRWIVQGKIFETIEGNTSPRNRSNGGMVMRCTRTLRNNPVFVHPKILD